VTRQVTFEKVTEWLGEVDKYVDTKNTIMMLVGNKIDLVCARDVAASAGGGW
jgi:GTPase SAR1 family protein